MRSKVTLIFILLVFLSGCADSQTNIQLIDKSLGSLLIEEISGEKAKEYVTTIAQYNRTHGAYENTGYEKAVNFVISELQANNVDDVRLFTYRSDGVKSWDTWLSRPGFRVKSATLSITHPYRSTWSDYSRVAVSLMPYSNGNGIDEAEVVYVGKGTSPGDYKNKDVKGKIVFADRWDVTTLMREAVIKRGALGIIIGFSGNTRKGKFADLVELNRPRLSGEDTKKSRWGFTLSKAQTDSLRYLLKSPGKVIMRAEVYAETFPGSMPIISACIRGSKYPNQEVIYMAHLDHYKPGANDNASGSAGLMEIAIKLTKLIQSGKICRPLRTIKFLWVPEWEGTAAYIENHKDIARRGIAGINFDMIGEDLELCRTKLFISEAPLSRPSFLNAIIEYYVRQIKDSEIYEQNGSRSRFNYEIIDYFCESDHMLFNDEKIGIPSIMLSHFTDIFWHTSYDTPDKVDPTELKRSILLGLFTGWTAATYDTSNIEKMMDVTVKHTGRRIQAYSQKYQTLLKKSDAGKLHQNFRYIHNYYDLLERYGIKSLETLFKYVSHREANQVLLSNAKQIIQGSKQKEQDKTAALYSKLQKKYGIESEKQVLTEIEKSCSLIIPHKQLSQSLSGWEIIEIRYAIGVNRYINNDMVHEMLNFTDGKNNLLQIRNAVCAEYREVALEHVKTLFDELKKRNYITF